jgi:hypothetical protein
MTKKFYDYETESGQSCTPSRSCFRRMEYIHSLGEMVGFNFNLVGFREFYDIYSFPKTSALIYVVGGDEPCHPSLQEGIAIFCEEKDKNELIGEITKLK